MTSWAIVALLVALVAAGVYLMRVALIEADGLDAADLAEREHAAREARRNRRAP